MGVASAGDLHTFVQFTQNDLTTCTHTDIVECHLPLPEVNMESPTCEMALFLNMPGAIQALCNFTITLGRAIPQRVTPISPNKYIVATSHSRGLMVCKEMKTPLIVHTVPYAITTIPCGCRLTIANM